MCVCVCVCVCVFVFKTADITNRCCYTFQNLTLRGLLANKYYQVINTFGFERKIWIFMKCVSYLLLKQYWQHFWKFNQMLMNTLGNCPSISSVYVMQLFSLYSSP